MIHTESVIQWNLNYRFQASLAKAETGLKESISMLLFEHPTTPEGQLTKRAMHDLKELRKEIAQVQEMIIEDEKEVPRGIQ